MCCVRRNLTLWVLFSLCLIPAALALPRRTPVHQDHRQLCCKRPGNPGLALRQDRAFHSPNRPFETTCDRSPTICAPGLPGRAGDDRGNRIHGRQRVRDCDGGRNEGRRSVIGSITCTGQQQSDTGSAILEQFEVRSRGSARCGLLEQDIDALLSRYEKLGFPLARCEVQTLESRPAYGGRFSPAACSRSMKVSG